MRQHYPGMVGHIVIKCVPCPNICSEALAILNHLSPYSFNASSGYENDRVPIGAITLFATASPRYQDFVNQTIVSANRVYQDFLGSEEGAGFTGPVCMIGDSMGAILAYDSLCRNIRRPGSETSLYEERESVSSPPSPRLQAPPDYMRAHSDIPSSTYHNHNRLSTSSHSPRISESTNDVSLHFEVADFFIFGSPIGTLLAYRKVQQTRDNPGSQYIIPRPNCTQTSLRHLTLSKNRLACLHQDRYQKYPMGDGIIIIIVIIGFILRQILNQDLLPASSDPDSDLKSFVPNQAREKWIKKRTSVKIRNGAANHRGNDVVSLDGRDPVLQVPLHSNTAIIRLITTLHSNTAIIRLITTLHSNTAIIRLIRTLHFNTTIICLIRTLHSNTTIICLIRTLHSNTAIIRLITTLHSNTAIICLITTFHSNTAIIRLITTLHSNTAIIYT
ncbi:protein retinal degeneration B [Eurytemora carolleeae]|uniref:protein retinal degeneration B n=1 Tax=Eurytemora carolleeae TaxID=1294199 RepID=UPI000C7833A0|nr:protein retinal degeneration B [Eurytemora carolleeae]|eukprot:XP_023349191.1 protein retinal degeneration B-like [Eurytemora affinis]